MFPLHSNLTHATNKKQFIWKIIIGITIVATIIIMSVMFCIYYRCYLQDRDKLRWKSEQNMIDVSVVRPPPTLISPTKGETSKVTSFKDWNSNKMTKETSDTEINRIESNLSEDLFKTQSIADTMKSDEQILVDEDYLKFMATMNQGGNTTKR